MSQQTRIDEHVSVGEQPGDDLLQKLAADGFKTIVNMRTEGEDNQPLSPDDEGRRVTQMGLNYEHFPTPMESMRPERVDEFRERLAQWPAPVFVHCSAGKRSGAFVVMDRAIKQGWTGDETLAKAEAMGFECDVPQLKQFVKDYVDSRRQPS